MSDDAPDGDAFRIMVATDSHLGYMERDPVRGKDSFAAFEEVLLLAKHKKVDYVLLGGDLFHENKPSRRTLYRTIDILRRHCMGDEPVSFQIISEQSLNFKDRFGHVNYEDPYFSVGLPIFSIHGNHDDPTREGGVEALAALDLLHVTNLVNYFGKSNKVDDVEVNPILMQKGQTKIALYGLGSMRDERLNRMWQQKKVKFLRPSEDHGFFNIFVLHQNRDLGRGKKNCIHESMIPEWMDLVIWGHEHESQVEVMESLVGTFRISQPGSSVATSLCEGEAVPKRVGLLDIIPGNSFRMTAVPLSQVRPFKMGDIILSDVEGLDSTGANVDEAVGAALAKQVEVMVDELHQEEAELEKEPPEGQEYLVEKRDQVLIRLKVEHSDFPTLNNQRFGSQFMGRVANPSDLLLFYRRRNAGGGAAGGSAAGGARSKSGGGLSDPIRPDNLDDVRVEDLVMENLERADKKLSLLVEPKLKIALEDYVHKGDAQAMNDLVRETLEGAQKQLRKEKAAGNAAMIDDAVAKMSEKERSKLEAERIRNEAAIRARTKPSTTASAAAIANTHPAPSSSANRRGGGGAAEHDDLSDGLGDDDGEDLAAAAAPASRGDGGRSRSGGVGVRRGSNSSRSGATAAGGRRRASAPRQDSDEEEGAGVGRGGRGKRGAGGRRGTSQLASIDLADESEQDMDNDNDGLEDIDEEDDDDDFNTSRSKRKNPSNTTTAASGRRGAGRASSSVAPAAAAPAGARRSSARSAGRGRVRYDEDEGDGDSSEVEELAPSQGRTKRGAPATDESESFVPIDLDDDDDDDGDGGDGDDGSEFEVDDEEDGGGRGRGGRRGAARGKSKGKASAAASSRATKAPSRAPASRASGSRAAASNRAAAGSRGRKRATSESQQSDAATGAASTGGGSKKRRLPSWVSVGGGGGDDDDVEEVSSAVSAWGETR